MPKRLLITGCSSGIGLLTAVEAARRGHSVVATMRNLSGRTALDEAATTAGVTLDVRRLDVDDPKSFAPFIDTVEREAGPIDALVNNAGFGFGGSVYDLSIEEIRAQLETNFFGTVALTKAALPGMVRRRAGTIVQVSSSSSLLPQPGMGAYAASKRALDALSDALRLEVLPFGVQVTRVHPGQFKTEGFVKRKLAKNVENPESPYYEASKKMLALVDKMVAKRAGDPQVVARLLVDLVEAKQVPPSVVVGSDAKMQGRVLGLVGQRNWERIVSRVTGFDKLGR